MIHVWINIIILESMIGYKWKSFRHSVILELKRFKSMQEKVGELMSLSKFLFLFFQCCYYRGACLTAAQTRLLAIMKQYGLTYPIQGESVRERLLCLPMYLKLGII